MAIKRLNQTTTDYTNKNYYKGLDQAALKHITLYSITVKEIVVENI